MADHNTDREMPAAPQKLRQDPKYVAMESLATILVIVGAVLAGKGNTAAMAIVFVIAAFLFLIAALLNIGSIKAQRAQMEAAAAAEAGRQAPGYADALKTLSETPAGGANALEALIGAAGQTNGGML